MRFVFTKLFYFLFALGIIPLILSYNRPWLRWLAFGYDAALLIVAIIAARRSRLPNGIRVTREFKGKFAVGAETEVQIWIQNATRKPIWLIVKDEYPPQMKLSRLRESRIESRRADYGRAQLRPHPAQAWAF